MKTATLVQFVGCYGSAIEGNVLYRRLTQKIGPSLDQGARGDEKEAVVDEV